MASVFALGHYDRRGTMRRLVEFKNGRLKKVICGGLVFEFETWLDQLPLPTISGSHVRLYEGAKTLFVGAVGQPLEITPGMVKVQAFSPFEELRRFRSTFYYSGAEGAPRFVHDVISELISEENVRSPTRLGFLTDPGGAAWGTIAGYRLEVGSSVREALLELAKSDPGVYFLEEPLDVIDPLAGVIKKTVTCTDNAYTVTMASTTGIKAGDPVTGHGLFQGAFVTVVNSPTMVTLSRSVNLSAWKDADRVAGSPILTALSDTYDIFPGMVVSGTGIAAGSVIVSKDEFGRATMDRAATATVKVPELTFTLPATQEFTFGTGTIWSRLHFYNPLGDVPGNLPDHSADTFLEYGDGTKANLSGYRIVAGEIVNRVIASGKAAEEEEAPVVVVEDAASIAANDAQELYLSFPDQTSSDVLGALARAKLAPDPPQTLQVEAPPSADTPRIWRDIEVGDAISVTVRDGEVNATSVLRISEGTLVIPDRESEASQELMLEGAVVVDVASYRDVNIDFVSYSQLSAQNPTYLDVLMETGTGQVFTYRDALAGRT